MKKFITILLCIMMISAASACSPDEGSSKAVSLQISDRDVDVEYMKGTDLAVFGAGGDQQIDADAALSMEFTTFEPFETDDRLFLVSGTGQLEIYGQKYVFAIDEELMSKVEVTDSNTVYESIIGSTAEIGGRNVELSIDFVASEDFSQAVATVSAEGGMLFFGDIFNDYLEYYNMILEGVL